MPLGMPSGGGDPGRGVCAAETNLLMLRFGCTVLGFRPPITGGTDFERCSGPFTGPHVPVQSTDTDRLGMPGSEDLLGPAQGNKVEIVDVQCCLIPFIV